MQSKAESRKSLFREGGVLGSKWGKEDAAMLLAAERVERQPEPLLSVYGIYR